MSENILEIKNLVVHYVTDRATVRAVNGLSISLERGEALGLVGETGAGKTTTALSIMQLVPDPPGRIVGGEILYEGMDLWVLTYHPLSAPVLGERGQGSQAHVGVFASTTLERPNPIEFLRAKVLTLDPAQGLLHVEGLDADDGAPILDIRPATSPRHRLLRSGEEMSTR